MAYEPLHHKYRPQTFADLVGQEAIAATLTNAILSERIAPAYLFTGPRGTGKTSSARILAKSLNCVAGAKPTPAPCGQCETCRAIILGSALDVIEIDAASNTGVDNIREIIERAQFAPVQCRYKVYVIDECVSGDSLVLTEKGLLRIDNPEIQGQSVLSYNENSGDWEYKKVIRWMDKGIQNTVKLKTENASISCTANHLIRTNFGWQQAKDILPGIKILSPVPAVVENLSIAMEPTGVSVDLRADISFMATSLAQKSMTLTKFLKKQKPFVPTVYVDAENSLTFHSFYSVREEVFKVSNLTGKDIPTKKDMVFGKKGQKNLKPMPEAWMQNCSVLSMEPCLGTGVSTTPMSIVAFHACDGLTAKNKKTGWNTRPKDFKPLIPTCALLKTKDTEIFQCFVKHDVTQILSRFLTWSSLMVKIKKLRSTGYPELRQKDWRGGTWMTVPSLSVLAEPLQFKYIQKDFPQTKTKLFPNGLLNWDTPVVTDFSTENQTEKYITTLPWGLTQRENCYQICDPIASLQWRTNFETVESVTPSDSVRVYDLEVEDNHNFVANGLLVHNCHMLSTAAFNALLKTLEEPPERVIFVLATTDPQRVLPTIISRCQRFDYRRIPLTAMVNHLQTIADQENINIDPTALTLVGQMANGGLRDAESLLDQLSLITGVITPEKVWDLVGAVPEQDLLALLEALAQDEAEAVLRQCRQILNRGREPLTVLQNLAGFYLNLLIAKTAPKSADLVTVTQETWRSLVQLAQQWEIGAILQGQQRLKESEVQLRNTTQPRLWLEVTLLNLLPSACVGAVVNPSPAQPITPRVTTQPVPPPVKTAPQDLEQPPAPLPPETDAPTVDLDNLWAQVLNHLSNLSQGLFRTQAQLTALDHHSAQVRLKSSPLLKIAQSKVQELEAAFADVLGRPLRVRLQGPGAGELEKSATVETPPPRPALERPAPINPAPAVTPSPAPERPAPPPMSQPVLDRKPILEEQPRPLASSEEGPKVSVQKALEQLAKSFDGAIIPPDPQEKPALESPKLKIKGRPSVIIPDDNEDDIAF